MIMNTDEPCVFFPWAEKNGYIPDIYGYIPDIPVLFCSKHVCIQLYSLPLIKRIFIIIIVLVSM